MENKPLPVGVDDFKDLIATGYYLVDKSLLIKELLDKKGKVNLFTRPRRFGKSLNMSMLRYFFEDGRDLIGNPVDERFLFDGLKIMDCGKVYTRYMGRFPVIQLTLKSACQTDYSSSLFSLRYDIAEEFRRHEYLLNSDTISKEEKQLLGQIMAREGSDDVYRKSLRFLSECLFKYFQTKVIILIDEYDVPLESAYSNHYYNEMINFIRSFFEAGLKTNPYLEFSVITGCLRISKESIFTGMNNLEIHSILSPDYDEYFGFTDDEVKQICKDYGLSPQYEKIREWYNGYIFGKTNIYNPWSVILYVKQMLTDVDVFPSSFWANTSSNRIVRQLVELADRDVKDELELLIAGGSIEKPVHEDITYEEVFQDMDNLWNFLFFTGYFRKEKERFDGLLKYITLKIPNQEVLYIFREKIQKWFNEKLKKRDMARLFSAIQSLDTETIQEEIAEILASAISYYDYYESFYHGFLAGILYGMDGYTVKSNRESGKGRTDLFLRPVSRRKTAYIFEFKVARDMDAIENTAEAALDQIADRDYDRELQDDGYRQIVHYGIAFLGKDCEVRVQG